jgi:hypothetical protein
LNLWRLYGYLHLSAVWFYLQARPLLRVNRAFERHASKIYTRAMFEKFGEILYEAGYYEVEVVDNGKVYIAKNIQADKREQWMKVRFRVTVTENREAFECEYGQFEHMGLLCCHVLKVLLLLSLFDILITIYERLY